MAFSLGPTNKQYVSAITMLDQREILSSVLNINNDAELTDIMSAINRYKPSKQPIYYNYTGDALYVLLDTTGATPTGSGTPTVTTTFTVATSGFVRKTDLIKFPNGKVGYVTNVTTASSQDTATIKAVDNTNLTHTAGQKLSPFSNAFGEQSKPPTNRRYGMTQYANKIQVFREVNEETDIQSMSTVEVSYQGKNYLIYKELAEKFIKHKADINGSMIGGYLSTTLFADSAPFLTDPINSGPVQTTRGLDQYVTTYGIVDTVGSLGSWTLATDQADLISQMLANKTSKRFLVLIGSKASGPIYNHLLNLGSGGLTSAKLDVGGITKFNYTVDQFKYMGFEFNLANLGILDHQEMFSQTDIPKSAYYVPLDYIKGSDGMEPRIQIRYMPHNIQKNDGNEYFAEFHTGAMAPMGATSDEAIWRTNWLSYQGLECLGVQHFAKSTILA